MGTQSASQSSPTVPETSGRDVVRRGAVALAAAVVANVAFVTVANVAGVAPSFEAYSPFVAARGTAVGVVGATLVYELLRRRREDPDRAFTAVAVGVYLLALVPVAVRAPTLPGATTLGVLLLPVMHAVAAVPAVALLTGRSPWP